MGRFHWHSAMIKRLAAVKVSANYLRQSWLIKDFSYLWEKLFNYFKFPIGRDSVHILRRNGTTISIPEKWLRAQDDLKLKVIVQDTEHWQIQRVAVELEDYTVNEDSDNRPLQYVAGVDVSYAKNDEYASVALIVCRLPDMKVVYKDCRLRRVLTPYFTGFLTLREVLPLLEAIQILLIKAPRFKPQVILVDGDGILNPQYSLLKARFDGSWRPGLACHLGVLTNIPCVGIVKHVVKRSDNNINRGNLQVYDGDKFRMVCSVTGANPLEVCIGHRISIETAVWVVKLCSIHRIPEPIRMADLSSREFLREKCPQND